MLLHAMLLHFGMCMCVRRGVSIMLCRHSYTANVLCLIDAAYGIGVWRTITPGRPLIISTCYALWQHRCRERRDGRKYAAALVDVAER